MFRPISELALHPRECDICTKLAENPYAAVWNCDINERISMCSLECLKHYVKYRKEYKVKNPKPGVK